MIVHVNRNSGIFSKQQTDELNKAFSIINDKIEAYKAEPLAYKNDVAVFDNCFILDERLLCIRIKFDFTYNDSFVKVAELPRSIPYNVWTKANNEKNESVFIHIKDKDVFAYGAASEGQYYLCIDIIIPN